jgi:hypothetical protein
MTRAPFLPGLAAFLLTGTLLVTGASATTTILYPTDDVSIDSKYPDTASQAAASLLYVGGNIVEQQDFWESLLKFNLGSYGDVTLNSAKLYLVTYSYSSGSGTPTVGAHEVTADPYDWSEYSMSWNTAANTLTISNGATSSVKITSSSATYVWDVTAAARNHQGGDFSLCMKEGSVGLWAEFCSKDCGVTGYYPYLEIDYTEPTTRHMGWENLELVLAMFGGGNPPVLASNVQLPSPVHTGQHALQLQHNTPGGAPRASVAYVTGLQDGDVVACGMWRWDVTPGAGPGCLLRAHWDDAAPPDPNAWSGDAGGNPDPGPGAGWDETTWRWTVSGGHTGLVIDCELLSEPRDTAWIDDLRVSAPPHATILFPDETPTPVRRTTWGAIKALYR